MLPTGENTAPYRQSVRTTAQQALCLTAHWGKVSGLFYSASLLWALKHYIWSGCRAVDRAGHLLALSICALEFFLVDKTVCSLRLRVGKQVLCAEQQFRVLCLFGVTEWGAGECSTWGLFHPNGRLQHSCGQQQWDLEGGDVNPSSVLLRDLCVKHNKHHVWTKTCQVHVAPGQPRLQADDWLWFMIAYVPVPLPFSFTNK